MSDRIICDVCNRVIYDVEHSVSIEITVTNDRYNRHLKNEKIHLCNVCDLKVAKALYPLMKSIAGMIEPNVFIKMTEKEEY